MSIILAVTHRLHRMRFITPWQCVLCHFKTSNHYSLCTACEQELPILSRACDHCAQLLITKEQQNVICGQCLIAPPPVDKTYALFRYEPPIMQFITRLKFHQQLMYADILGNLLIKKIEKIEKNNLPDLILPVPLHKTRLQDRGFNQALEIARPLAKHYQIPLDIKGVSRIRSTQAQSHLSAHERKKNIVGAFAAHRGYDGLSVAIVDDVITTTHTVFELASLLKQKGARQVIAWCAARTEYR